MILLGGMQEPGHGAGSVLYALLSHPDALAEVVGDLDELLPAAIDEGMRWIAPIGTQGRRTTRALELGGVELPADAPVAAVIASANRDESDSPTPMRSTCTASASASRRSASAATSAAATPSPAHRSGSPCASCCGASRASSSPPSREFSGWEFRAPRGLRVALA